MEQNTALSAFSALLRAIEWGLVPIVLAFIFAYGFFKLPSETSDDATKSAARAAKWAGMLILVLFVVSRKSRGDTLNLSIPAYDFSWTYSSIGIVGGFFLSWLVSKLRGSRVLAAFILALVAGSAVALYSYFFIPPARSPIIFLALGFALGSLLEKAFGLHGGSDSQAS